MNVVLIDIDSLRFSNMGCYGYGKDTTPRIDELAEQGVIFQNAYAEATPTLPFHAGLFSGRSSLSNEVVSHHASDRVMDSPDSWSFQRKRDWNGDMSDWWTLPELLFRNGFETGMVSSLPRKSIPWISEVWGEIHQPKGSDKHKRMFSTVEAKEVADLSIDFIDRQEDDFFLYSHFWDPHVPYQRSQAEVEKFEDSELPLYPSEEQIQRHQNWNTWHSASELEIKSREDLRQLMAEYNAEVSYVDRHVGRIIEKLKEEGCYEDSLIIVTADHGEEFGEQGIYQEHATVYEPTQHIPLIVKPSQTQEKEVDELVTNLDIAPTIADYLDLETPVKWQGSSLKPLIEDEQSEWRESIVLHHGLYTVQRAVRKGKWKLIKTLHSGILPDIPQTQLYDLEEDQEEQRNIAQEHPEKVEELEDEITDWKKKHQNLDYDPFENLADKGPAGYRFNQDKF